MKKQNQFNYESLSESGVFELSHNECHETNGGLWPAIVAGMGAVLLAAELYKWGYDYATERLNKK